MTEDIKLPSPIEAQANCEELPSIVLLKRVSHRYPEAKPRGDTEISGIYVRQKTPLGVFWLQSHVLGIVLFYIN